LLRIYIVSESEDEFQVHVYVPGVNPNDAMVLFAKVTVPDTSTLLPPIADEGAIINFGTGDTPNE
jgi:hypothetical protein